MFRIITFQTLSTGNLLAWILELRIFFGGGGGGKWSICKYLPPLESYNSFFFKAKMMKLGRNAA